MSSNLRIKVNDRTSFAGTKTFEKVGNKSKHRINSNLYKMMYSQTNFRGKTAQNKFTHCMKASLKIAVLKFITKLSVEKCGLGLGIWSKIKYSVSLPL